MLDNAQHEILGVLDTFNTAMAAGDGPAMASCFETDGYWRDLLAFTWNISTMQGHDEIATMLASQLTVTAPLALQIDTDEPVEDDGSCLSAWVRFETALAHGYGFIRVRDGRIWTLLTTIVEMKGHPEMIGTRRPFGVNHGAHSDRRSWLEKREAEFASVGIEEQPYVLIVGGGQGGIALGARLRALGVPTVIVERNERAGDSWRNRYKSLCLHDPVWYDHLPYLDFPDNWPVFAPKDKLGDWLETYTRIMELNYWTGTVCKSCDYDAATSQWTVEVERDGKPLTLRPAHVVLATGMSGKPQIPQFKGMESFKGDQHHSSRHPGPDAYRGKKAVVIGSNNSSHDICAALWEAGADVTMVQRSTTHIVRSESLMELGLGPLYSQQAVDDGITTAKADMIFASIPYGLLADFQRPIYSQIAERDRAFYDQLAKAGFMLDWGADDSGLFMKYLRRGSGYYIDVGASQLIIDGKIKLASGVEISEITETAVCLSDGTQLEADLIVYATGYTSMNSWAADLMGQEVADRVGKCWGLGSETPRDPGPWLGELRNMWKPTRQEGLWFHGGNLHQSRHYSLYLAMQLKARMEGLEIKVYDIPETHHLA
jgi:putative flavoprotein involved in K+ transport